MVLLTQSGVFIEESCDVIGMEFLRGKWVCYSRFMGDFTSVKHDALCACLHGERKEQRAPGTERSSSAATCIGFLNVCTPKSRPHPMPMNRKALRIGHAMF